jgi:pimeloyl-ACP methyl ester carboxylesterase
VIDAVQQVVDAARQVDAAPAQTVITSGLVDIGGYKLFIDCQGEGSPTVVMDAGLALTGRSWILVQPKIARFTRVCTYDRAGLGGSDPSPITPRTSQVVADELYALLTNAGIEGPYVLVWHSSGGFCVRLFAHDHPDRVAGMVLVDTPHEDLYLRLEEVLPEYVEWLRGLTNAEGVDFSSNLEEVQAIRPADGSPELGDKPLVVLVAGSPNAWAGLSDEEAALFLGIMRELQADLVTLSTNSVFTVADEASHLVQRDRPDRVVEAVQQVVDAARTGDPLE